MKNKIFISVFALLLAALSVLTLALPKKSFSENENRALAEFPVFSAETIRDGSFTAGLSDWLSDHFALRDFWVSVKAAVSVAAGKRENGGVYLAKDGSYIDGFSISDMQFFETNAAALESFTNIMKINYNINVISLISPTATEIYAEKLPRFAFTADSGAMFDTLNKIPGFVDVRNALSENADKYIFYRTDHHWTALGAYIAYVQYKNALGEAPLSEGEFDIKTISDDFYGTLYSRFALFIKKNADTVSAPDETALTDIKLTNSGGETFDSIYFPEKLSEKDKYLCFLGGNDSIVEIETGSLSGRRLLLIKDSYANSFLPYIINDYEYIAVIDLRYYTGSVTELAEREGITDALVLYNLKSFASDRYFRFAAE